MGRTSVNVGDAEFVQQRIGSATTYPRQFVVHFAGGAGLGNWLYTGGQGGLLSLTIVQNSADTTWILSLDLTNGRSLNSNFLSGGQMVFGIGDDSFDLLVSQATNTDTLEPYTWIFPASTDNILDALFGLPTAFSDWLLTFDDEQESEASLAWQSGAGQFSVSPSFVRDGGVTWVSGSPTLAFSPAALEPALFDREILRGISGDTGTMFDDRQIARGEDLIQSLRDRMLTPFGERPLRPSYGAVQASGRTLPDLAAESILQSYRQDPRVEAVSYDVRGRQLVITVESAGATLQSVVDL